MKEHKAACRLPAFDRSAVAEHARQAGHEIQREDIELRRGTGHSNRLTGEESEGCGIHKTGSKGIRNEQRQKKGALSTLDKNHSQS